MKVGNGLVCKLPLKACSRSSIGKSRILAGLTAWIFLMHVTDCTPPGLHLAESWHPCRT